MAAGTHLTVRRSLMQSGDIEDQTARRGLILFTSFVGFQLLVQAHLSLETVDPGRSELDCLY